MKHCFNRSFYMSKALLVFLAFLIIISACTVFPLAETGDESVAVSDSSTAVESVNGYSTWQIAILYCVMFAVISVIGVMFIKIVKKNERL